MRFTDQVLQRWRIAMVSRFITHGSRILDIGSADGALFQQLGTSVGLGSLGIDPALSQKVRVNGFELFPGYFPEAVPASSGPFDVVTMLAVLEHFPPTSYVSLRDGCERLLKPGGKLLITVPSPQVDGILAGLKFFRLLDGMSLEEHHGYRVDQTTEIFSAPQFKLLRRESFQLGLNNLFVFERAATR